MTRPEIECFVKEEYAAIQFELLRLRNEEAQVSR